MLDKNDIRVSIICVAYNQEKYIKKAIDSFLMQKTNFNYEIIIHDDASTDNTINIINEYKNKYPEKIITVFEKENIYSKNESIFSRVIKYINGDYIAVCDGDDYWTDVNKLQTQFDILENNPNCSSCVHTVLTCKEDGSYNEQIKPSNKYKLDYTGTIKQKDFAKLLFEKASSKCPFQTSSFFYRKNIAIDAISKNWSIDRRRYYDANMLKMFLIYGDVYYINKPMSVYRIGSESSIFISSKKNLSLVPNEMFNLVVEDIKYDNYSDYKYHKFIMCEIYKYLLYSKEIKINIEKNNVLMKDNNLNLLFSIKYVGFKRIIIHFINLIKNLL